MNKKTRKEYLTYRRRIRRPSDPITDELKHVQKSDEELLEERVDAKTAAMGLPRIEEPVA